MITPLTSLEPVPAGDVANGRAVRRLLIVDPEQDSRDRLVSGLSQLGYEVQATGSAAEALEVARREPPAMAVTELRLTDGDGLDLVRELRRVNESMRIVVVTGFGSIASTVEAMRAGAENFLVKPVGPEGLIAAFEKFRMNGDPSKAHVTRAYTAPTLARMEWEHIQRVLSDTGGNISESARRLGIHRRSLQRKLQRLAPTEGSKAS